MQEAYKYVERYWRASVCSAETFFFFFLIQVGALVCLCFLNKFKLALPMLLAGLLELIQNII